MSILAIDGLSVIVGDVSNKRQILIPQKSHFFKDSNAKAMCFISRWPEVISEKLIELYNLKAAIRVNFENQPEVAKIIEDIKTTVGVDVFKKMISIVIDSEGNYYHLQLVERERGSCKFISSKAEQKHVKMYCDDSISDELSRKGWNSEFFRSTFNNDITALDAFLYYNSQANPSSSTYSKYSLMTNSIDRGIVIDKESLTYSKTVEKMEEFMKNIPPRLKS